MRKRAYTGFVLRRKKADPLEGSVVRCSFCNKSKNDARKLIAGPNVFICDECVEVCSYILTEGDRFSPAQSEGRDGSDDVTALPKPVMCALCLRAIPQDDGIIIENRGMLCAACVEAIKTVDTGE